MSQNVKFVFTTLGTKGDILPMLAVAQELHQKSHEVFFLSNSNYRELVLSTGISFHAIAPPELSQDNSIEDIFNHSIFPSFKQSYDFIENLLITDKNVIIVNNGFFSGSNFICEKYNLPLIRLLVTPTLLMSGNNLPYPYSAINNKLIKWMFKKFAFSIGKYIAHKFTFTVKEINKIRKALGLKKISSLDNLKNPDLTLMAYPQWYAPFDGLVPKNHYSTGFLNIKKSDSAMPDALFNHTSKYGKSLIFTPGTGVTDVHAFFSTAIEICNNSNLPGIFISPCVRDITKKFSENILLMEYVDFNMVFPHAYAVFHHGGIGTIGHAISAGVLQVVVPHRFDQPDNAYRIEKLGLGVKVDPKNFKAKEITVILKKLMGDKKIEENLQQAAIRVNTQDSLSMAYQLLIDSKFS